MTKKIILVLFALLFISLNVNALIENPDFENVNANVFSDSNSDN